MLKQKQFRLRRHSLQRCQIPQPTIIINLPHKLYIKGHFSHSRSKPRKSHNQEKFKSYQISTRPRKNSKSSQKGPKRRSSLQNNSMRYKTLQEKPQKAKQDKQIKTLQFLNVSNAWDKKQMLQQFEDIQVSVPKVDFKLIKFPLKPKAVIHSYEKYLTNYEKQEILQYKDIYYFGQSSDKIERGIQNSFDDQENNLIVCPGDHFAYKYEVIQLLGKGAFGQVFKCIDHKTKQVQAIKVICNKKKMLQQGFVQVKILKIIKRNDPFKKSNILTIVDSFVFRDHMFIVTQLLSMSLYEYLERNRFKGLNFDLIRKFSIQLLQGLMFLQSNKIVHCDLKPQNILFKNSFKSGIKIIDFGSGCLQSQRIYSYIQSRYYRAPQVIFGVPYDSMIDMWSFGCILVELATGQALFPAENEPEQVSLHIQTIGFPPLDFLYESSRAKIFFQPCFTKLKKQFQVEPNSKDITKDFEIEDNDFIDLVKKILVWEPSKRLNAREALLHNFILKGLPGLIRKQHQKEMLSNNPYGLIVNNPYDI